VLIHLVAGAHNDALMIGLMLAGLSFATRANMAAAIGLIATATLIKAPAVLALACVAQLWAARLSGRLRLVRSAVLTGAGGLTVIGCSPSRSASGTAGCRRSVPRRRPATGCR
jgi:hypothetical protein